MKKSEVKVGMPVVVNHLTDTTLYTVKKINGMIVDLVYFDGQGREIYGGDMDISILRTPNAKQLKYNKLS